MSGLFDLPGRGDPPPPSHAAGVRSAPDAAALPGLEPAAGDGEVVRAARTTLAALQTAGNLEPDRAVMAAALLTAARALDRAATNPRSKEYAVANLVAQIRETWSALVPETIEGSDDAFDQLANDLRDAMADHGRRAAAVRDTP